MKSVTLFFALCACLLGCSGEAEYYTTIYEASPHHDENFESMGGMGGMSNTGWSASGKLLTTHQNKGVKLQASFPEMTNYTVQFFINNLDGSVVGGGPDRRISRPKARIEWSVKGNTATRIVDVFDGTSLSGPAESVNVFLFDGSLSAPDNGIAAPDIEYFGSIQVTKGSRGGSLVPSLKAINHEIGGIAGVNYGSQVVAPGELIAYPIPPNSGIQSFLFTIVHPRNVALDPDDVTIGADTGAGGQQTNYVFADQGRWLPLPTGAQRIAIINDGASGTDIFTSVFFGVDG